MKREKSTVPKPNPCRIPRQTQKKTIFVILINHTSALIRKERLSPTSKARRETSRNQFVEKSGASDGVESF